MNNMRHRVVGYDLARSLAIFGMVIVNFTLVIKAPEGGADWIDLLTGIISGRAAVTFVVLAGIGMALMARSAKTSGQMNRIKTVRNLILKRALFLFFIGLAYWPIWPADILHFYGVYMAIGAFLLFGPPPRLWHSAVASATIFVVMIMLFDYEIGWNFETLSYKGFWTPTGFVRNLFYNGFHPVFPWLSFLLLGIWLGQQDLLDPERRRRIMLAGLVVALIAECISLIMVETLQQMSLDISSEDIYALLGREPMPPMPLFMLQAGGTAVFVVGLCVGLGERFTKADWLKPLISTGQLSFTVYVAHVILGMGSLEIFGWLENPPPFVRSIAPFAFFFFAVLFSHMWRKKFSRGPLEWVMRKMTG